jgi:hypothetical protein
MGNSNSNLTFEKAREIVYEIARKQLLEFMIDPSIAVLSEQFAESECCWIFFRNKAIIGPPERALTWDGAYAISKKGEIRLIGDLSESPEQLKLQIDRLSNYFKDNQL